MWDSTEIIRVPRSKEFSKPKQREFRLVNTISEEGNIIDTIFIGDRIRFSIRKTDSKEMKSVTDTITSIYRHFCRTKLGYCVQYRDIREHGI